MLKRIITGAIGLPIFVALIAYGGLPLIIVLLLLSLVGLTELYNALSMGNRSFVNYMGYAFTVVFYALLYFTGNTYLMYLTGIFLMALLIFLVCRHETINIVNCAVTFFGFFYVPFFLSFIYLVRTHPFGKFFVWLILITAFGCDTFAYFTGINLGKHKLIPSLSPKKTVEGAVGGVLGSAIIALLYGVILSRIFDVPDAHLIVNSTVVGAIGAVFAMFGDLAASAVKRYTKIKDFGRVFPGHGGVLDRFDSVLLTAPMVYFVMMALYALR